jgi:glycyl-tRNA synthetase beta chain
VIAIAHAIRDHYKPVGQGDVVPTAPVSVAVALADKLDTLSTFFFEGMKPSGSGDPFALRRAALSILLIVQRNNVRLPIASAVYENLARYSGIKTGRNLALRLDSAISATDAAELDIGQMVVEKFEKDVVVPTAEQRVDELFTKPAEAAFAALIVFFADRLKVLVRLLLRTERVDQRGRFLDAERLGTIDEIRRGIEVALGHGATTPECPDDSTGL